MCVLLYTKTFYKWIYTSIYLIDLESQWQIWAFFMGCLALNGLKWLDRKHLQLNESYHIYKFVLTMKLGTSSHTNAFLTRTHRKISSYIYRSICKKLPHTTVINKLKPLRECHDTTGYNFIIRNLKSMCLNT